MKVIILSTYASLHHTATRYRTLNHYLCLLYVLIISTTATTIPASRSHLCSTRLALDDMRLLVGSVVKHAIVFLCGLVKVLGILIRPPKVLFAFGRTGDPWWQQTSLDLVGPGVFDVLVGGLDAAAGRLLKDQNGGVEDDVGHDSCNQAVSVQVSVAQGQEKTTYAIL